jgi:hypothetical protein
VFVQAIALATPTICRRPPPKSYASYSSKVVFVSEAIVSRATKWPVIGQIDDSFERIEGAARLKEQR